MAKVKKVTRCRHLRRLKDSVEVELDDGCTMILFVGSSCTDEDLKALEDEDVINDIVRQTIGE